MLTSALKLQESGLRLLSQTDDCGAEFNRLIEIVKITSLWTRTTLNVGHWPSLRRPHAQINFLGRRCKSDVKSALDAKVYQFHRAIRIPWRGQITGERLQVRFRWGSLMSIQLSISIVEQRNLSACEDWQRRGSQVTVRAYLCMCPWCVHVRASIGVCALWSTTKPSFAEDVTWFGLQALWNGNMLLNMAKIKSRWNFEWPSDHRIDGGSFDARMRDELLMHARVSFTASYVKRPNLVRKRRVFASQTNCRHAQTPSFANRCRQTTISER